MNKIEIIKQYLDSKDLKFWTLNLIRGSRHELYTIFDSVESIRDVSSQSISISLYVDHEDSEDKYTGESSFSVSFNSDIEEIKKGIDRSIAVASMVKNERYEIEQNDISYECRDHILPKKTLLEVQQIQKDAMSKMKDVSLSSAEYFLRSSDRMFVNSAGNTYTIENSSLALDMVFLAGPNQEVESIVTRETKNSELLDIASIIEKYAQFTKDSLTAQLPKTGKYKVIFTGEVLEEFFSFFTFHALGSAHYNKYAIFNKGDKITTAPLTIYSDPTLEDGLSGSCADDLGFTLRKFNVIKDGVLENIVTSHKYSKYLEQPFTGGLTNVVVAPGEISFKDMVEQENTILIERVSCFSPKELTGDFSSEIRLGYIFKGGKMVPIKGGSFSGNIRDLIDSLSLSKDMIHYNSYYGPEGVCLEGVDIAGE